MPDTIIGIGDSSFYNCSIKSITLGPKVEILGTCAFQYSKLEVADLSKTRIRVPKGIYHFYETHLVSISLPDCLEFLPHFFISFTNITEFTFPRNLKFIDQGALSCISKLNVLKSNCPDIVIYRGVAYSSDFKTLIKCPVDMKEPLAPTVVNISDCGSMSSCKFVNFVLDAAVQNLGSRMFRACPFLESVDLSSSIATVLPFESFVDCMKLVNIILPDTLISLSFNIFCLCQLPILKIPSSVSYMDPNTFLYSQIHTIEYCGFHLLNVSAPLNCILKTNTKYTEKYFMQQTDFLRNLTSCLPERTPFPIATKIPKNIASCVQRAYSSVQLLPYCMLFAIIIS